MSQTLTQVTTDLREHLNDDVSRIWSDTQLQNGIKRALRSAWPSFWVDVRDEASFTGASSIAVDTAELTVPAAFLFGKIDSLWYRRSDSTSTTPVYAHWVRLTRGFRVDPLTSATPKIRFARTEEYTFELRLYGRGQVTIPATAATAVDCTNNPGFVTWLLWQTEFYLRRQEAMSGAHDPDAQQAKSLMAKQEADAARRMYKMQGSYETLQQGW